MRRSFIIDTCIVTGALALCYEYMSATAIAIISVIIAVVLAFTFILVECVQYVSCDISPSRYPTRLPYFVQDRVGADGKVIRIRKFRTMCKNRNNELIICGYPARILRRLKLDEVPQIINWIRGDVKLVGPRPLMVHEHTVDHPVVGIIPPARVIGIDQALYDRIYSNVWLLPLVLIIDVVVLLWLVPAILSGYASKVTDTPGSSRGARVGDSSTHVVVEPDHSPRTAA